MASVDAQSVTENEPDTLAFKWYMSEDGAKCIFHEEFTNSEALLTHLSNVGPTLPDLLAIARITRFEVLGEVSNDAADALNSPGAVFFPQVHEFARS